MPNLKKTGEPEIRAFVDWCYGKENDQDEAVAATARHVRAHCGVRPCVGFSERLPWQSIEAMRTSVRNYGPSCSVAQFDTAYAAFVAS
jgi:hypothetical protein